MPREKGHRYPVFMSKPSPSLAATRKMNLPEVEARIERLSVEADRLRQKIERV